MKDYFFKGLPAPEQFNRNYDFGYFRPIQTLHSEEHVGFDGSDNIELTANINDNAEDYSDQEVLPQSGNNQANQAFQKGECFNMIGYMHD